MEISTEEILKILTCELLIHVHCLYSTMCILNWEIRLQVGKSTYQTQSDKLFTYNHANGTRNAIIS